VKGTAGQVSSQGKWGKVTFLHCLKQENRKGRTPGWRMTAQSPYISCREPSVEPNIEEVHSRGGESTYDIFDTL
jgi:hypothetical protein